MDFRKRSYLIGFLGLVGCEAGSIYPILPDGGAQFDGRLLGTWVTPDGDETALITGDSLKGYAIVYIDSDGDVGRFLARLGPLDNHRVLEIRPVELDVDAGYLYTSLFLPLHSFLVLDSVKQNTVQLRSVEVDSVEALLTREPGVIPHARYGDRVVLTAPAPELQRFLAGILRRPGVLGPPGTWRRQGT